MSAKLDRIGLERDKARRKRDEWDRKFKELDQKYKEQENVEIHEMVHAANLSSDQLAALLRNMQNHLPDGSMIPQDNQEEQQND